MRPAFILAAILAATPATSLAQSAEGQSTAQPVYGPTLEDSERDEPSDNGAQYRLRGDLDGCYADQHYVAAPTLYEDEEGTNLSYRGSGFRLRMRFGEGSERSSLPTSGRCGLSERADDVEDRDAPKVALAPENTAILPK